MDITTFTHEEIAWVGQWGMTDAEVADALDEPGYHEDDPSGFSELAVGSDFIWLAPFERWVRENNSFYEAEDERILTSLREKLS